MGTSTFHVQSINLNPNNSITGHESKAYRLADEVYNDAIEPNMPVLDTFYPEETANDPQLLCKCTND